MRARTMFALSAGLKDTGFVEGENVAITYRWAEGQIDRLPAFAAELVRRQVAVIAGGTASSAFAAKAAATTVPIVFGVSEDLRSRRTIASQQTDVQCHERRSHSHPR